MHAIQVHYANGWFAKFSKITPPSDDKFLGKIRLEAATGEDFSDAVSIPKPDGMMERSFQFVKWLAKENPQGGWEFFLTDDRKGLLWDRVVMAGSSHGSTTAARFAIHQRVDRVVMFCGPRDQLETWQALPSATPSNRFFGFSHVLDSGWTADHYCRSWELLGLHQYGPIVNVDQSQPPFANTRRLITAADVKNDDKRAHSSVTPGMPRLKTRPASSSTKPYGVIFSSSPWTWSASRIHPTRTARRINVSLTQNRPRKGRSKWRNARRVGWQNSSVDFS